MAHTNITTTTITMLHFVTHIRVNKTQQPDSWPTMTLNQSKNRDTHIGHRIYFGNLLQVK